MKFTATRLPDVVIVEPAVFADARGWFTESFNQRRFHDGLAALGLPMLFDGIYPTLTPEGSADYARPLQLLARSIAFTDPLTGAAHRFESQRHLLALTDIKE